MRRIRRRSFLAGAGILAVGCASNQSVGPRRWERSDDSLQSRIDAMLPGETLDLDGSTTYRHDRSLVINTEWVSIRGNGARILATDESKSAVHITADGVTLTNVTVELKASTKRWTGLEQHKIVLDAVQAVRLEDIICVGSAGAGVFVCNGSAWFSLRRIEVRDSRADGIHVTGGSRDGLVDSVRIDGSGDDGMAVVSYLSDSDACRRIGIRGVVVRRQSWGRGVSVVGGDSIEIRDIDVQGSPSAGLLIGTEGDPFNTRAVTAVRVDGGRLVGCNARAEIDHGSVLIAATSATQAINDVQISRMKISRTGDRASAQVSVISDSPTVRGIVLNDFSFDSDRTRLFRSNVPTNDFTLDNWRVSGFVVDDRRIIESGR
ncbi:MAG: hypothetical protein LLG14_13320 [Nocardiaceae bacterium]|nr:hypothetical protein [Nocardiaceae bacterium]